MIRRICRSAAPLLGALFIASGAAAQTPQPFPKPGEPARPQPPPARTPPPKQPPPAVKVPPPQEAPVAPADPAAPTEEALGMPIYPGAQFLTAYDAGRGQHIYLFGTNIEYGDIVGYYRTTLRQRGSAVYEQPPVHTFEVGRYRSDAVAFTPGVTVKDYSWGGAQGYLNPVPGAQPSHFRTIIQIVSPPSGAGP